MEKYLPIGSLVLLKNATKKIMVVGFVAKSPTTGDEVYDYIGCLYPEGVISSDKNLLFNHDQIDKIYYIGYVDNDEKKFKEKLKDIEKSINKEKISLVNQNKQNSDNTTIFNTLDI